MLQQTRQPSKDHTSSPDRSRARAQDVIQNGPGMTCTSNFCQCPVISHSLALPCSSYSVNIPRNASTTQPQSVRWLAWRPHEQATAHELKHIGAGEKSQFKDGSSVTEGEWSD